MSNSFFSWLIKGWRARKLAQHIILQVHALTDPPVTMQKTRRQSTLSILEEISAFLASLQAQKDKISISAPSVIPSISSDNNQPEGSANSEQESQAALDVPSVVPLVAADDDGLAEVPESTLEAASEAPVILPLPSSIANRDQQVVSATARNLMKLGDWVLQAKAGRVSVGPEVLDEIYRQLTRALATEGISLIDTDGPCDYERQMVMGTRATEDPALDDHVYSTVRPGYLFHGQLIRPQEVIVFASEDG